MRRKALAIVFASSLAISGSTVAHANEGTESQGSYEAGNDFPKNPSEADLAEAGVTRADADKMTQDYVRGIEEAQKSGEVSEEEANQMLELAESPEVKSWVVVYLFSNLGLVSWRWFRGHLGDKG